MVSNLRIVKEVLKDEIGGYKFSFIELVKISRKDSMKNYYIGDKFKSYYKPVILKDANGKEISAIYPKPRTSLFYRNDQELLYRDILENNDEYQEITDEYTYGNNLCINMKNLDEIVKKIRWKQGL